MRYLLICDLDGTLTGDKEGVIEFNEIVSRNKQRFHLVYSSGRFRDSMISVIEGADLVQPDIIISNVGTEIYYAPNWNMDEEWKEIVGKSWNKESVTSILDRFDLELQTYNKRFVIPYYIKTEALVREIKEILKGHGVKVIYTKKRCLDVIPEKAGKGSAAEYIGNKLNLPMICCGDSENDLDMLLKSKYGILVGNAPFALKRKLSKYSNIYIAKSHHVKGVVEGLEFYDVID